MLHGFGNIADLMKKEIWGYEFNLKTGDLKKQFDLIVAPNISYKVDF